MKTTNVFLAVLIFLQLIIMGQLTAITFNTRDLKNDGVQVYGTVDIDQIRDYIEVTGQVSIKD